MTASLASAKRVVLTIGSALLGDQSARRRLHQVGDAIVLHDASTQFADSGLGFGGEIGIDTGRLHAGGPVGAKQLTTFKYVVRGSGQAQP